MQKLFRVQRGAWPKWPNGNTPLLMKKSHIASLQFVVNSCIAKIFNTRSKVVIEECQFYFNFSPVSDQIAKRTQKFFIKYENSDYVQLFALHGNNYLLVKHIVKLFLFCFVLFCLFYLYYVLPLVMVKK